MPQDQYRELIVIVWLVVMLLPVVAFGSYAFGWRWRGRYERSKQDEQPTATTRPATPEEIAVLELLMRDMDRTLTTADRAFDVLWPRR